MPLSWVYPSSLAVSVVFVALPIYGLYAAAKYQFSAVWSVVLLIAGLSIWGGGFALAQTIKAPMASGIFLAISQSALLVWCFAIGNLLALILKDRNLLLPIAIFLALFDMWLVFAPEGLVQQSLTHGAGKALAVMAYQAPATQAVSAGGKAAAMVFVGPADFLFISMFFAALYRFSMRTRQTMLAIVPVLAGYLLLTLTFPNFELGPIRLGALPALLPIGLTVLIVNRDQFKLSRDEMITTVFIAVVGLAVVTWRISLPGPPPPEPPEMSPDGPVPPAPPGMTWTSGPGRFPSVPRIAPRSTPSPR